ncbi:hypothetical protein GCM10009836_42900 [Pseudonocardia ailaonensis]|uniref:Uncharacterized protein n=1 Tax=Pseudonocardia ailaonensis TaxID=367279 RepID=A0ABN2N8W3_9PSEU
MRARPDGAALGNRDGAEECGQLASQSWFNLQLWLAQTPASDIRDVVSVVRGLARDRDV